MAPELADGITQEVHARADIYSLGKIVYFTLSGGQEFDREKHRDARYDLTSLFPDSDYGDVNDLLDKMIAEDPAARYQDVSEVRKAIRRIVDARGIQKYRRVLRLEEHLRHDDFWTPLPDAEGYTNEHHTDRNWEIYGPYGVTPQMPSGIYEARFRLRARDVTKEQEHKPVLQIDVISAGAGEDGHSIHALRLLRGRDLHGAWREHSLTFSYGGERRIEFRLSKRDDSITIDFAWIRIERKA